jgi:hypothetical protein
LVWILAALALALTNPGRQIADLIWVIIPMWFLAAKVLERYAKMPTKDDRILVIVGSIFILILLFYWLINLAMMTRQYAVFFPPDFTLFNFPALDENTKLYCVRLMVTIFIPLLVLLLPAVVYSSWPGDAAYHTSIWGVSIFLIIYLVSAATGFTDDRTEVAGELWMHHSSPGYLEEIRLAVEEASLQIIGHRTEIDLVYQIDSTVLHWTFRDFPNASYRPVLDSGALPSIILNTDQNFGYTEQGQFYRGQRAVLHYRQAWGETDLPPDFDRWLLYRESPVEKEWLTIWTRADLFPLYTPLPEPEPDE